MRYIYFQSWLTYLVGVSPDFPKGDQIYAFIINDIIHIHCFSRERGGGGQNEKRTLLSKKKSNFRKFSGGGSKKGHKGVPFPPYAHVWGTILFPYMQRTILQNHLSKSFLNKICFTYLQQSVGKLFIWIW